MTDIEKEKEKEKEKEETKKCIHIVGQSNRYQMKKLINENHAGLKKRINLDFPPEYFSHDFQFSLLREKKKDEECKILLRQIEKKISGYKQQDNDKKLFDEKKFVTLEHIVNFLVSTEMKCNYCNCEMRVLYENVREPRQWTVDRIDNDLGHNTDNYVLACLKCNIERRRTNKDKFTFTKQLRIIREDS
jgi:hypothetical protein